MIPRHAALGALVLLLLAAAPAGGAALFRPLVADPREPTLRWRMVSYTEDWRYGADVFDSTTHGGVERDRRGLIWEADAGHTFRFKPLRRLFGFAPPWTAYQLSAPAGVFPVFDNSSSLLNADYQYGVALDVQWTGPRLDDAPAAWPGTAPPAAPAPALPAPFARPVLTSRIMMFHRSSHLGDEYLVNSRFGRNQDGNPLAGALFDHPPVKRVDLTFEALAGIVSAEWSPGGASGHSVARAYGGCELRPLLPPRWGIGGLRPHNFSSPAWRVGGEWRSAGNFAGAEERDGLAARAVNRVVRSPLVHSGWFAAFDLRLAKPYNFAAADNSAGETEVWTPHLWTDAPFGREFRHMAGSWHAMLGAAVWPQSSRVALAGREWLVTLEWYRGYAPDGQFLDQRLRWHPRWYVVPALSARF